MLVLHIYVDDIIITWYDLSERQILKDKLSTKFEMNDIEQLKYFFRIEVAHSNKGICISHRKYVFDLLPETRNIDTNMLVFPLAIIFHT